MNICPITYEQTENRYSLKGLKLLAKNLENLNDIELTKEEQLREAITRAPKMSIQGVQPKLSAVLNSAAGAFDIVDIGGKYILKPPHNYYAELPENEDLTMRLAALVNLNIPLHGLIYAKDGSLTYFIKRFDRIGRNKKVQVEDFAQLSSATRSTKYNSSMEKVVKLIDRFCTFPAVEKVKLFELTLFNYLVGNEDMHLKNFSIIKNDKIIELSPFYDLVNTTIALPAAKEEIALPIRGRKSNLNGEDLIKYFGNNICGLNEKVINKSLEKFKNRFNKWAELIEISFLSSVKKDEYKSLVALREKTIFS